MDASPGKKSWSIYGRPEITSKYTIEERVGSGAYSDVYRARRLLDSATVALKEVHDHQSAFREIEALESLRHSPNVVLLHEYFWREDEDAVLVLEFLRSDLAAVVREARKAGGLPTGQAKRWMVQILVGVDACHQNMVVHRDLKPGNLLVGDDGVLKLADFGQARTLMEPSFAPTQENSCRYEIDQSAGDEVTPPSHEPPNQGILSRDENYKEMSGYKPQNLMDEADRDRSIRDGDTSCLATGTVSDIGEDGPMTSFSYEVEDEGNRHGSLTSCVGTRWYRAPELLYGSTDYGLEVDLWSLGCIFAELLSLEPLFPGASDIDQLSQIVNVLGNLTEDVWPGCANLPDYKIISFGKVDDPKGVEACLPYSSPDEVSLVKKLICYNPANRATAMELLHDEYFGREPLPVPVPELLVPSANSREDEDSGGGWFRDQEFDSDPDAFDDPPHYSRWL